MAIGPLNVIVALPVHGKTRGHGCPRSFPPAGTRAGTALRTAPTIARMAVVAGLCVLAFVLCPGLVRGVGADMPWTTYQAEDMKTTGTVLGPKYDPY